jgi:hypothetical protein
MTSPVPSPSQDLIDAEPHFSPFYRAQFEAREKRWLEEVDDCMTCSGCGELFQEPCPVCSADEMLEFAGDHEFDERTYLEAA